MQQLRGNQRLAPPPQNRYTSALWLLGKALLRIFGAHAVGNIRRKVYHVHHKPGGLHLLTCPLLPPLPLQRMFAVQAHALAEAVLMCLQHPSRSICETAIEYFEALSMVPVAERAPFFGQPLCRRLLQALLRQACYPADFVTWVECTNDDKDDFSRFRCAPLLNPGIPAQKSLGFMKCPSMSWQSHRGSCPAMLQVKCPEGCFGAAVCPAEGRLPTGVQQIGYRPKLLAT